VQVLSDFLRKSSSSNCISSLFLQFELKGDHKKEIKGEKKKEQSKIEPEKKIEEKESDRCVKTDSPFYLFS
jgi:hypothetical protein